jgi:hypothetical protein
MGTRRYFVAHTPTLVLYDAGDGAQVLAACALRCAYSAAAELHPLACAPSGSVQLAGGALLDGHTRAEGQHAVVLCGDALLRDAAGRAAHESLCRRAASCHTLLLPLSAGGAPSPRIGTCQRMADGDTAADWARAVVRPPAALGGRRIPPASAAPTEAQLHDMHGVALLAQDPAGALAAAFRELMRAA